MCDVGFEYTECLHCVNNVIVFFGFVFESEASTRWLRMFKKKKKDWKIDTVSQLPIPDYDANITCCKHKDGFYFTTVSAIGRPIYKSPSSDISSGDCLPRRPVGTIHNV